MATLYFEHINRSLPTLREWLDGKWGLVLSHPGDFEDHSLERDRWLEILQEAFRGSAVKPIAFRPADGAPDRGWVSTVMGDERRVRLTHGDVIDIAARRLRDQIMDIPVARFAVVVDPSLLCQGVLMYQQGTCLLTKSPLDLLGPVMTLRCQSDHADTNHWPRRAA